MLRLYIKKRFQMSYISLGSYAYSRSSRSKQSFETQMKRKQSSIIPFDNSPQHTLKLISEWRSSHLAPVDSIGCESLIDSNVTPFLQKYQLLISLMLSIQTKDEITSFTVRRLQQEIGLQPRIISQASPSTIQEIIKKCNYYKVKTKNIIRTSALICQKGMPETLEQVTKFPGVGVKIGVLYINNIQQINAAENVPFSHSEQIASNKNSSISQNTNSNSIVGIGVDTHVHRIANRLEWVKTIDPKKTELQLQKIIPKDLWRDTNKVLVGFGQILCKAKRPLCRQCPVNSICNSKIDF